MILEICSNCELVFGQYNRIITPNDTFWAPGHHSSSLLRQTLVSIFALRLPAVGGTQTSRDSFFLFYFVTLVFLGPWDRLLGGFDIFDAAGCFLCVHLMATCSTHFPQRLKRSSAKRKKIALKLDDFNLPLCLSQDILVSQNFAHRGFQDWTGQLIMISLDDIFMW